MNFNDDLMRWYVGTKDKYEVLNDEQIDPNGCYFLLDTRELLLDRISYSSLIIFFSGIKPANPSTKKIYFDTDTLNIYIYNGIDWICLFNQTNVSIIGDMGAVSKYSATGTSVRDYVESLISTSIKDYSILKIYYNTTDNRLELYKGELHTDVQISAIGNKIIRDSKTGNIYLLDSMNVAVSTINIPSDNCVASGTYNDDKKAIDLIMKNGNHVYIMASDLINLYNEKESDSMMVNCIVQNGNLMLQMELKIAAGDNGISIKDDGLFVQCIDGIEKLSEAYSNMILSATANGVKGAALIKEAIDSTTMNAVTESAVASCLDVGDIYESNFIKNSDMVTVESLKAFIMGSSNEQTL